MFQSGTACQWLVKHFISQMLFTLSVVVVWYIEGLICWNQIWYFMVWVNKWFVMWCIIMNKNDLVCRINHNIHFSFYKKKANANVAKKHYQFAIFYWCVRADSKCAPSQWETALLCNDVSHWLGASLESAMCVISDKQSSCSSFNQICNMLSILCVRFVIYLIVNMNNL